MPQINGRHRTAESFTWGFDRSPDDDRRPSEVLDDPPTAIPGGETIRKGSGNTKRFVQQSGEDTLLSRVETNVRNPTSEAITDTITVKLHTIIDLPGYDEYISQWGDPDDEGLRAGQQFTVTLNPNEGTTLAVSGDGRTNHPDYTASGARVPGSISLPPDTPIRVIADSQNALDGDSTTTGLTIENIYAYCQPAYWKTAIYGTGALKTSGPQGRTRSIMYPDDKGVWFKDGIRVGPDSSQALQKLVSGTAVGNNKDFNGDGNGLRLSPRSSPPQDPLVDDIEIADGANWDPGNGRGVYRYTDTGWTYLEVGDTDTNAYTADGDGIQTPVLSNPPSSPQTGAQYYADGTGWDPGNGAGTYEYTGSSFRALFPTA